MSTTVAEPARGRRACVRARSSTGLRSSVTCGSSCRTSRASFSVRQFPNGSANLTYLVRFGEDALVVRRPPVRRDRGRRPRHAPRVHRAVAAARGVPTSPAWRALLRRHGGHRRPLPGLGVPPGCRGLGPGAGRSWRSAPEPGRRIGFAVVDALADLHLVDAAGCDLGYLGRPDGYLDRQVRGWQRRWDAVATKGRGAVDRVAELLARHLPESGQPALVHNDFKVDNCQFTPGDPDQVTSVFDWDMATLGDPLTDLGTLLNYWPDGATPAEGVPGVENIGLPSRDEVVEPLRRPDPAAADPRRRRVVRGVRLLEDGDHHAAALRPAPAGRDLRRTHERPRAAGGPHRRPRPGPRRDPRR